MDRLQNFPPIKWAIRHPRLAAWIVLSLGMVILLVIEARDIGLLIGQWIALVVACVLVAGACVWIVSWEDSDDEEAESTTPIPTPTPSAPVSAAAEAEKEIV